MRVIAGRFRGRALRSPTWAGLRPTSDRTRETLFAILTPHLERARLLDVCAGTGAVGIEALSRGTRHVTFVERDRRAVRLMAQNLASCGIDDGYTMVHAPALEALGEVAEAFDIVFVDPPYEAADIGLIVEAAAACVAEGGRLVVEHSRRRPVAASAGRLVRVREVRCGDTMLTFYAAAGP
jgi:16S rRNA (guanine966-N2)-methyltransferase